LTKKILAFAQEFFICFFILQIMRSFSGDQMQKLFSIVIVVLIHGCTLQNGLFDHGGNLDGEIAMQEAYLTKRSSALPESFVECPNTISWSTMKFSAESEDYSYAKAQSQEKGPFVLGSGLTSINEWPSDKDLETCRYIARKLRLNGGLGDYMEFNVYQQFDKDEVFRAVQSDNDFHGVSPKEARLENISYFYEKIFKNRYENYTHDIPVSVTCENSWWAKKDTEHPFRIYFQQPKGRCYFSTKHYKFSNNSSADTIIIALNGFYEMDSEQFPDKVMLVKIEHFGFIRE
jgi:hypothetical protein